MSNENHNSTHNWKSKLDELESLPGEMMQDKKVAWEKIQVRLEEKKPQRKAMWYWIAAACISILFIIPFFIPHKKNYRLSDSEQKQNQHEKHVPLATVNDKKDSVTDDNSRLPEKNVAVIFDKSNEIANKNIGENKKDQLRLYDTVSTRNQITETIPDSLQTIDTSSGIASTMQAKKRLPVVHINELADPDNVPQVARSSEKPSVHFLQLASQEVYNSSAVSIMKNFVTINFKTSPN
ncbi:MAG: hypothetical protein ACTHK0_12490 [Ginsengibacter sp.]